MNKMKAIKMVDELIALAKKCKLDLYNGAILESRYDMNLISSGLVFALEAIDLVASNTPTSLGGEKIE